MDIYPQLMLIVLDDNGMVLLQVEKKGNFGLTAGGKINRKN